MLLSEWVNREGYGAISRVARKAGLHYQTVFNVARRGIPLKTYDAAKRASLATDGEVSIAELCEPPEADDANTSPGLPSKEASQ